MVAVLAAAHRIRSHRRKVCDGFACYDVGCSSIADDERAYFFILRALPSKVVTIACMNPSFVM